MPSPGWNGTNGSVGYAVQTGDLVVLLARKADHVAGSGSVIPSAYAASTSMYSLIFHHCWGRLLVQRQMILVLSSFVSVAFKVTS